MFVRLREITFTEGSEDKNRRKQAERTIGRREKEKDRVAEEVLEIREIYRIRRWKRAER